MDVQEQKPKWWPLYLMVVVAGGVLWLESHAALAPLGHQAAQIGILLLFFGGVFAWLRAERVAFMRQTIQDAARRSFTYRFVQWEPDLAVEWPRREEDGNPKADAESSYAQLFNGTVVVTAEPYQKKQVL